MQKSSKHDIWFQKAEEAAQKSLCMRPESRAGVVAVRDGKVIAEGWNGAVKGIRPCAERGYCVRKKRGIPSGTQREVAYCICGEQRMICHAARDGVALGGAVIYLHGLPCAVCLRLLIEAGITAVYYKEHQYYGATEFAREIIKESGFPVVSCGAPR